MESIRSVLFSAMFIYGDKDEMEKNLAGQWFTPKNLGPKRHLLAKPAIVQITRTTLEQIALYILCDHTTSVLVHKENLETSTNRHIRRVSSCTVYSVCKVSLITHVSILTSLQPTIIKFDTTHFYTVEQAPCASHT